MKEIREMVRTLSINQKTNLQTKHCMEGYRAHATHATKNWKLRSMNKSSAKSHRFFYKKSLWLFERGQII